MDAMDWMAARGFRVSGKLLVAWGGGTISCWMESGRSPVDACFSKMASRGVGLLPLCLSTAERERRQRCSGDA